MSDQKKVVINQLRKDILDIKSQLQELEALFADADIEISEELQKKKHKKTVEK